MKNPLKNIWKAQVKVLSAGKLDLDADQKGIKIKKTTKQSKPLVLSGLYYSTHPDIKSQFSLKLEFREDGVTVVGKKKEVIKTFGWDEIIGYENESQDKSQTNTSQRVTATRMVAVGVFALAAPKSKTTGTIKSEFYDILHTTTGDIVLETEIAGGGGGGSIGDMNRNIATIMINKRRANTNMVRRLVTDHATGKP